MFLANLREFCSELWIQMLCVFFAFYTVLTDMMSISDAFMYATLAVFLFYIWRYSQYKFVLLGSFTFLLIVKLFYLP